MYLWFGGSERIGIEDAVDQVQHAVIGEDVGLDHCLVHVGAEVIESDVGATAVICERPFTKIPSSPAR